MPQPYFQDTGGCKAAKPPFRQQSGLPHSIWRDFLNLQMKIPVTLTKSACSKQPVAVALHLSENALGDPRMWTWASPPAGLNSLSIGYYPFQRPGQKLSLPSTSQSQKEGLSYACGVPEFEVMPTHCCIGRTYEVREFTLTPKQSECGISQFLLPPWYFSVGKLLHTT